MKNDITRRDFISYSVYSASSAISLCLPGVASAIGFQQTNQSVPQIIDRTRQRLEVQINTILKKYLSSKELTDVDARNAFTELYEVGSRAESELVRQRAGVDPRIQKVQGFEDEPAAEMWGFTTYGEFVEKENMFRRNIKTNNALLSPAMNASGVLILLSKILGALLAFRSSWFGQIVQFISENMGGNWIELLWRYVKDRMWDAFKDLIKKIVVMLLITKRAQLTALLTRIAGRWVALSWVACMVAKIASGVGQIIAIAQLVIGVANQWSRIIG